MRTAVVLALVLASTAARAQPASESSDEEKSPALAVTFSIAGTAAGIGLWRVHPVLGVIGLTAGPAIGRWHNEEIGGAGMAVRLAASLLVLRYWDKRYEPECNSPDPKNECSDVHQDRSVPRNAVYLGLAALSLSTILDIVEAKRGADRYNRRLHVAPTVVGDNTTGLGVGLQW